MCRMVNVLVLALSAVGTTVAVAGEYPVETWRAWSLCAVHRYPAKQWLQYETPEEAGWSSEKLAVAKDYFDSIESAAVMVVYDGAVLAAWGDVDRRYMCHSVRKSLLSSLVGVHAAKGTIDLNKTLAELGIDDVPPLTEAEKRATVFDLLRSRSGVFHEAAYATSQMRIGRPDRGSREPGEIFWYNNWDFNTLGVIFEQETGASIFEEFDRQLANPLRMQDYRVSDGYYHYERRYSIHPAYPFRMSARDMARFGLLYLRKGRWNDRQVLPAQWVHDSVASHFHDSDATRDDMYGYGYYWWPVVRGPFAKLGMYSARGHGGHSIDVLPEADLVFVHRVNTFGDSFLGVKMDSVSDAQRFELLDLVLRARVGPLAKEPSLVPLAATSRQPKPFRVAPKILTRYVGEYRFDRFTFRVTKAGDELVLYSPRFGHFPLRPLSETRFMIGDLELPVRFELDAAGEPVQMVGEFVPGEPRVGQRVAQTRSGPIEPHDIRSICPN